MRRLLRSAAVTDETSAAPDVHQQRRRRRRERRTLPRSRLSSTATMPYSVVTVALTSFLLLFLVRPPSIVHAATPTASIRVLEGGLTTDSDDDAYYTLHASGAKFGPDLPFGYSSNLESNPLMTVPDNADYGDESLVIDPLLCDGFDDGAKSSVFQPHPFEGYVVLVPRGGCTFELKALHAQRLGASGIVVYNNLSSRYGLKENETSTDDGDGDGEAAADAQSEATYDDIIWPKPKNDYECSNGRGWIPKSTLSFDPLPYDGSTNDPLLTGTAAQGNLCASSAEDGADSFHDTCDSLRCLLTNKTKTTNGDENVLMEACCAWDIHFKMNTDSNLDDDDEEVVLIPALFVTMEQGDVLLRTLQESAAAAAAASGAAASGGSAGEVRVVMYDRWYPRFNASSVLLWILGTFVTWLACRLSAKEYRNTVDKVQGAIDDGTIVFRGNGGNGNGRRRADTEETVESDIGRDDEEEEEEEEGDDVVVDAATQEAIAESLGATPGTVPGGDGDVVCNDDEEECRSGGNTSSLDAADVSEGGQDDFQNEAGAGVDGGAGTSAARGSSDGEPSSGAAPATGTGGNNAPSAGGALPEEQHQQQHQQQQSVQRNRRQQRPQPAPPQQETLELTMYHAIGFLVFASAGLFILFFFQIYDAVKVLYGIGCSGALSQVVFYPLYTVVGGRTGLLIPLQRPLCGGVKTCGCNEVRYFDVLCFLSGYAIGISWLYVGFTHNDPQENVFYWVTQDFMGASICILFLGIIRLNSIKVATALLLVAFVYDIFFVFITPYIFDGESVMISVATSGGEPDGDPDFCEKYPDDGDCEGGDPLPLLLTIPRINDYRGGSSLLGLGDIVLPGLLISFAARLDVAKTLVKICRNAAAAAASGGSAPTDTVPLGDGGSSSFGLDAGTTRASVTSWFCIQSRLLWHKTCNGYFPLLVVSYAVGLLGANLAVYLMKKGQPALLYLVPACLGTMVVLGRRRNELHQLWAGPIVIKRADRIMESMQSVSVPLRPSSRPVEPTPSIT